jgi:hypothetical protein
MWSEASTTYMLLLGGSGSIYNAQRQEAGEKRQEQEKCLSFLISFRRHLHFAFDTPETLETLTS